MSSEHVNLAVLIGRCSNPPAVKELPSGSRVANFSVAVKREEHEPATSVPVAVWDPSGWLAELDVDDEVVVIGRVHRRFWRSASGTESRVEVIADTVARSNDRRRRPAVVRRIRSALDGVEL